MAQLIGKFLGRFGALVLVLYALQIALSGTAQLDRYTIFVIGVAAALLTILIGLIAALAWVKSQRHQLVFRNAMQLALQCFVFCSGPLVMLLAIPAENPWRIAIALGPVGYIAYRLLQYAPITVFFRAPLRNPFGLTLTPALVSRRDAAATPRLTFAHLTDLHLTKDKTLEGDLDKADVTYTVSRVLAWALRRADLILVTGDITDQARAAEWKTFHEILHERKCPLGSGRIFVIPGNHDLSLSADILPGMQNVVYYDRRALLFIQHVLTQCPSDWRMLISDELVSVRTFLAERETYLKTYQKHPPYPVIPGFWTQHEIITPDELLSAADAHIGTPWPSPEHPTCGDFLEMAFPMVMRDDANCLVIGLNSNNVMSKNISNSAMGLLGDGQLKRLRAIISRAQARMVLLLIHHHIGFPPNKLDEFRSKYGTTQTDALTLLDADELGRILATVEHCCVLHGHKHFPYHAALGSTVVVSGHSALYGPHEGQSGATAFQINADGKLAIMATCSVAYPRRTLAAGRRGSEPTEAEEELDLNEALPPGLQSASGTPFRDFWYDRIAPVIGIVGATVATLAWLDDRWYEITVGAWTAVFHLLGWELHPVLIPCLQAVLFLAFVSMSTRSEIGKIYTIGDLGIYVFNVAVLIGLYTTIFAASVERIRLSGHGKYEAPPSFQALMALIPVMGFIIVFLSPTRLLFRRLIAILIGVAAIVALKYGKA